MPSGIAQLITFPSQSFSDLGGTWRTCCLLVLGPYFALVGLPDSLSSALATQSLCSEP